MYDTCLVLNPIAIIAIVGPVARQRDVTGCGWRHVSGRTLFTFSFFCVFARKIDFSWQR